MSFPQNGFIVESADIEEYSGMAAFQQSLQQTKLKKGRFAKELSVRYTNHEGQEIAMSYAPDRKYAKVTADGEHVDPGDWSSVCQGRYLKQEGGSFTVSNGNKAFTVDFSGHMPVYR